MDDALDGVYNIIEQKIQGNYKRVAIEAAVALVGLALAVSAAGCPAKPGEKPSSRKEPPVSQYWCSGCMPK